MQSTKLHQLEPIGSNDPMQVNLSLPFDKPIEQTVIGALMLDKSAFKVCNRILNEECFHSQKHQTMWKAMEKLAAKNSPIDIVTVTQQIKEDGLLGREILEGNSRKIKRLNKMREQRGVTPFEIVEPTNKVASAANIEYHSRILYQIYMRRKMIVTSYDAIGKAQDSTNDIFDLYQEAAKDFRATNPQSVLTMKSMNDTMTSGAKEKPARRIAGTMMSENSVIIIFSDPGTGKTIFSTQLGDVISRGKNLFGLDEFYNTTEGKKTILFDFEMEETEVYQRYKKPNKLDGFKWNKNFHRCGINPEFIDYDEADTLITNEIELIIEQEEPDFVIIDNITFISSESSDPKMATKIMKKLSAIQKRSNNNLTLLIIAHTPKRDPSLPIELRHLAGAKSLSNFSKNVIAISKSKIDPNFRYIKQLKNRQDQENYGEDNVILCAINKNNSGRLEYEFRGHGSEADHLLTPDIDENEVFDIIHECIKMNDAGSSLRELEDHVKVTYGITWSHTTIGKKMNQTRANGLPPIEEKKKSTVKQKAEKAKKAKTDENEKTA